MTSEDQAPRLTTTSRRPHRANRMIVLWMVGGMVVGMVYVVVVGFLEIQVSGTLSGGVYDLNNAIVAVTGPQIPFLQYASLAVLNSLLLIAATRRPATKRASRQVAFFATFAGATLVLICWGFALQGSELVSTGGAREGVPEGLTGWILKGGLSVVVHTVVLAAGATAIATAIRLRNTNRIRPGDMAAAPGEVRLNP